NILSGAVRSGKTMAANVRFTLMLRELPPGDILMAGKTKHTIKRNVLNDLFDLWGKRNYSYNASDGVIVAFGRRIYVVGATDEKAEGKIRGMSIAGYYGDEESLKPESFFNMVLSRMDKDGAKAIVTTNPDNPHHWLRKFMDREDLKAKGLLKTWNFTLEDNLALSKEVKDALKSSFSGVFYRRMILGEWCVAEGLIYDNFRATHRDQGGHIITRIEDDYDEYVVAVDYGTNNPCVFNLYGIKYRDDGKPIYHCIKGYYYDSNEKIGGGMTRGQKSDAQYYRDLVRFIGDTPVDFILLDPSAASFEAEINSHGEFTVVHADNDVENGSRHVMTALNEGRLFIHANCVNNIREKQVYSWDQKAAERGQAVTLKKNDHTQDAERYLVHYFETQINSGLKVI